MIFGACLVIFYTFHTRILTASAEITHYLTAELKDESGNLNIKQNILTRDRMLLHGVDIIYNI